MLLIHVRKRIPHYFIFLIFFASCVGSKKDQVTASGSVEASVVIQNPVLPGDFADPSVVRVGKDYWATATSSEWAPLYPILHSTNLQDWKIVSHVFPENTPSWAEAHFWAPEISYEDGTYYIYYTAKKKNGPLCVGVASSKNATGPYRDHGPIVCQEAGAIDGFPIRDEAGKLYLIWKEDGNSRQEPTPMWGQEMNEKRTELIGERFELFRNDPSTWEGNLVEGAYIIRKDGYFYAFYSGDACCGRGCTYGIGVARAKELKGPWEKYDENPLKQKDANWKCMGHGTMVQSEEGKYYFMYHGYSTDGTVYTGRQGLLEEIQWGDDGWPGFRNNAITRPPEQVVDLRYDFDSHELPSTWQWPVGEKPGAEISNGYLRLESNPGNTGSILGHRTVAPDFEVITEVNTSDDNLARYGLAAIGDPEQALGISVRGTKVIVWKIQDSNEEILSEKEVPSGMVQLKMTVIDGENYKFAWSSDGSHWNVITTGETSLKGHYLPPWDRAVRIGFVSKGPKNSFGEFNFLNINYTGSLQ